MGDAAKLRELLERCEKGRGSDRELDVDIAAMLIDATKRCDWYAYQSLRTKGSPERPARSYWERTAPRLTVCMDAVVNLAEHAIDGPAWNVDKRVCGGHVNYTADVDSCDGHGPSAPRALLSAVLSALISQAEEGREPASDAWPAGCIKPNSCGRNMQCMYAPSGEQCRHFDRDISAEVQSVMDARPNTQTEQERP